MVCGINHGNLALIEEKLNVRVQAPGGKMIFKGKASDIKQAQKVVMRLYERAIEGQTLGAADVRSALSFTPDKANKPKANTLQFGSGKQRVTARNPAQQAYLHLLQDAQNDLVFGLGAAGTGKTFLAIAYGASLLVANRIERLVIARPALEAGERLGFLPGDIAEKIDPYMIPIWDALEQTIGSAMLARLRDQGKIQVAPLAFMRGRTLSDAFVVLDEGQNASIGQMQMVLTRLGEGSKIVVTGDADQSDLPKGQASGLVHAVRILDGVKGVAIHEFCADDVVRHPLVVRIVKAYEADRKS
ncbi:Phosphate starvation-inducible protein PhoH, predicted ATPase [hydrothermal vent metagenome]|uniref:PhoH-like protein n=1 Tax=hydrothermal vent metagenome TaxID=652676 RepID=A0A3B0SAX3_9ZZZZ